MLSCLGGVIGIIVGSLLAILAGKLLGDGYITDPDIYYSIVYGFGDDRCVLRLYAC